ncbi:HNH endonuclease [Lactiplantibacillus plantarum]|uniref:HNH endonuclease n=1 Tax=Lactiplantibacillus plantarum TaxID=1590 RepID=A0AAX1K7G3_LACPN|nr:HNH endonuclease [Lactiplantibacillus plantarum]QQM59991.1 HNH endonuclease [Lactiplantibacillus plantarum]
MIGPVEFWKKHPDIEGIEISSFGRVRSVKGHYYKFYPINSGYLQAQFNINGKHVNKYVHRLVAQTFIPNPNNLPQVNHKDGDRTNNNSSNLEWCTSSYNCQYREKFGISNAELKGYPVFAINLSTLEVSRFKSRGEASQLLGVYRNHISDVIKGKYKQTHGYWFVKADEKAADAIKRKLHDIGETGLKAKQAEDTMSTNKASDFVRQVLVAYALERKLAYGKQKLA